MLQPLRGPTIRRALLACVCVLALPSPAQAARPLEVGFADDALYGGLDGDGWLTKTADANAGIIRVNLYWSVVAKAQPTDPRDPADPAYDFSRIDAAIRGAEEHHLDVMLTVLSAPRWAEGPDRPSFDEVRLGAWRPDAAAYGDFAHAVATRYSGSYVADGPTLPAVEYFQAWNEPNLNTYIAPQWDGKTNVASDIYVELLNHFYDEVKAVDPQAQVVTAGAAPYGDPPGGANRTRPLRFFRELLCLDGKLRQGPCPNGEAPKFDVLAQHPINREDSPTTHAAAADDVEVADFGDVTKTLRAAEKLGTPATPGRHQLFADEVWWQTNPPDRAEGISLKTQARWIAQSLYLLWKQGASKVIFLQFRDAQYTPGESSLASYQTGVYAFDGERKPAADAVAFPFVTDKARQGLVAWGKAPTSGRLIIQAKDGKRFRRVARLRVSGGQVFEKHLRLGAGRHKLRARVGGETSPVWIQKR